ncbi:MAG TPA: hypothetical protein VGL91_23955 [Acidobacteriota bacterium]|jgi:hypothetical protein
MKNASGRPPATANIPPLLCASSGLMRPMEAVDIDRLIRMLLSSNEPDRSRFSAASELARVASRCINALQQVLGTADELTRGEAAAALAGIDVAVRTSEKAIDSDFRFPRGLALLLTHSCNVPIPLRRIAYIEPEEPRSLDILTAEPEECWSAIQAVISTSLPLPLSAESAVKIECTGTTLFFLPTMALVGRKNLREATAHNTLAGVVVRRRSVPHAQWSVPFYVLTQPADKKRRAAILVVSSSGTVVLTGELDTTKTLSPFLLKTVKYPGNLPVEVRGVLDNGKVRLESVRADLKRTHPPVPQAREHKITTAN